MSARVDLPNEIFLNILKFCTYVDGSLFKMIQQIRNRRIREIYEENKTSIHRCIRRREHSEETISLLDRLRCNDTGMGHISLMIFDNIHFTTRSVSNLAYFFSTPPMRELWDGKAYSEFRFLSAHCEGTLENERTKFGLEVGTVTNWREVRFIQAIEAYVTLMYRVLRVFTGTREGTGYLVNASSSMLGLVQVLDHRLSSDITEDSPQLRCKVEKAILQFLIATTHFHDKRLSLASRDTFREILRDSTDRWLWFDTGDWEQVNRPYVRTFYRQVHPKIIYDYTYANSLPITELAKVCNVAELIMNTELRRERPAKPFAFTKLLAYRCGVDTTGRNIPTPGYSQWNYFEALIPSEVNEYTRRHRLMILALDSGMWFGNYENNLTDLEECQQAFRGWKDKAHQVLQRERDCYTTFGHCSGMAFRKNIQILKKRRLLSIA
ncbi:hypothetical protein BJ508DRAFT_169292 [Ascobolus immersus RN42]|uniref:Uncharacterized protein n=1 Tax=Ascobolus immersus RN42 TaxID=1160509 RepID=A0A3N4HV51_ASCIM|nr:hypothetical protein BJ508DRAFT_169292 [Ascobolus immersus RN42]